MKWMLIVIGILANAGASVLAKTAPPITMAQPLANLTNFRLIFSVGLFGVAFLLYTAALQKLPLNIAHPVSTAGAIILVGLCSAFIFHEKFEPMRIAAYLLLACGIGLLIWSGLRGA